ncbi:MBL fold metallo-hydrolase [Pelomyxa schiedti]|nr:MBL fold metallo-hydrolase [Pelomyxa schiedti]
MSRCCHPLPQFDAPSENDYSLGILIQFGKLLYSTTGDLSGEYYGSYNNVENYTYPRIGSVDVMKVNHHGSSHSTSDAWVNALSPTVSLISVGATNTYSHPAQAILDKLQAAGSDVYTTQKGNPTANYGNTTVANSDIIITSYDGETFTVQAGNITRTYSSKKNNKPPTCKT